MRGSALCEAWFRPVGPVGHRSSRFLGFRYGGAAVAGAALRRLVFASARVVRRRVPRELQQRYGGARVDVCRVVCYPVDVQR